MGGGAQRWGSKVLLALAATLVTLLVWEVAFRALGIRGQYHEPRQDMPMVRRGMPTQRVPFGFVPHAAVRSTYDSDPRGYFGPSNTIDHVHNSVGWRDVEHTLAKPPSTYRILGLGDSYLWGQGVHSEDVCLTKLGVLLADRVERLRVETINAAKSGTNTQYQRDLLVNRGLAYDPDLVIVHFVLNDVEPDLSRRGPKVEFFKGYTSRYQREDVLSQYSSVWSWARQTWLRGVRGRAYIRESVASFQPDSPGWALAREALDDLSSITRRNSIGLLVVIFPFYHGLDGDYPFQPIHDVVRGHCEREGIPVVDLRDAYRNFSGPELWVHPTDQHPNEIAHDLAARAMLEFLLQHAGRFGLPLRDTPATR